MSKKNVYRVVKVDFRPFDNWETVTLFFLQRDINGIWRTITAHKSLDFIWDSCHMGSDKNEKIQAYNDFFDKQSQM